MSKTRVFIYGSCVSRDTFEHLDPDQFELVQYVARQSALSAYTRPVTLIEPPTLESQFQQRMVAGDFASSLQALIPEAAPRTDLVLVDLTDERLGAYVLPDGSVVTRSTELIQSGAEQQLPAGSQHLPFGSEQHFQYWSQGIAAVGELIRHHMPHAAVALLDVPWAEWSETGAPTPDSFGVNARDANPVVRSYAQVAASALGAQVVSVDNDHVTSSPHHPWGEAPFHYSEQVYLDLVRKLTGTHGRAIWGQDARPAEPARDLGKPHVSRTSVHERRTPAATATQPAGPRKLDGGPDFIVAGAQHAGAEWFAEQLAKHPEVFVATGKGTGYFNRPARTKSQEETSLYIKSLNEGLDSSRRGDCTPDYFWSGPAGHFGPKRPNTAAKIQEFTNDDLPIFIVLRNPVARAVYAYWHHFALAKLDPTVGIFRAPKSLGVIDQGFYGRRLRQWSNTLGRERLNILLYDDLVSDPVGVLSQSLAKIGVAPSDNYRDSVSSRVELRHKSWVQPFRNRHPLDPQEIAALVEVYRQDTAVVEQFLGRELKQWSNRDALVRNLSSKE